MSALLWPMRIVLYGSAAFLGLGVIYPAVGGGIPGLLLAAPTASIALAIDVFVSSKVRKENIEQNIARRIVVIDAILSKKEDSPQQLPEAEVEEVLPPERKDLPPPRF